MRPTAWRLTTALSIGVTRYMRMDLEVDAEQSKIVGSKLYLKGGGIYGVVIGATMDPVTRDLILVLAHIDSAKDLIKSLQEAIDEQKA